MKKDFLVILGIMFMLVLPFVSCNNNKPDICEYTPQEFFDNVIKHSIVKDSAGHTLILHEFGNFRGSTNYSFSIEHSPECKKCCEIYD